MMMCTRLGLQKYLKVWQLLLWCHRKQIWSKWCQRGENVYTTTMDSGFDFGVKISQFCLLCTPLIYALCNWQIPQSTYSQILQSMDSVLSGFHTLEIDKFLNWWIDRCINLWIVCRVWNLLIALKNLSICILWNNHTIYRLMHLWIHKLRNLSIPRVWNLPSTESIDCRICQSVRWEYSNHTIYRLKNL